MKALIVETGRARGALAAARALDSAGWTVGIGTPSGGGLASVSKAVSQRHRVPQPQAGVGRFVAAVNEAIRAGGYELVFGGGDAELIALSSQRDEIDAEVPYATHDRVMRVVDKLALAEAAEAAGLLCPDTAKAEEVDAGAWTPPVVVKASVHAPLASSEGPGRLEAEIVHDRGGADRRIAEIRAAGLAPILQRLVPGRLMGYVVVADRSGNVVAEVAQLADATWPPRTGISARARIVAIDRGLADRVARLLGNVGWFGLAQLQFVLADDGQSYLIDFNGRFYGSLALAVAAGANLPATWAALATGRSPGMTPAPRIGTRYQWLEGDLRRAFVERRGGLVADLAPHPPVREGRGPGHGCPRGLPSHVAPAHADAAPSRAPGALGLGPAAPVAGGDRERERVHHRPANLVAAQSATRPRPRADGAVAESRRGCPRSRAPARA